MGKLKWFAFAVLLWCPAAWGQCTGQYANDPTYQILIPKDYAAQGGMTATLNIQAAYVSGAVPSHRLTVTPGTWIAFNYAANVPAWLSASASPYWTYDGGSTRHAMSGFVGLNGSTGEYWQMQSGDIGHFYTIVWPVTATDGSFTQDRITLSVAGGTVDSIAFQDGLDTNFYWQTVTTGGGSSMLTSCQECQAGTTQHCINATHTPYSTIQLTNDMSGESQLIQGVQSGNVARSNESLSFSASLAISVLPGDTGTISIDHKIICSADGVIFEQTLPQPKTSPSGGSWNPSMTAELAFTKMSLKVPTHCTPKLDSSGKTIGLICDVAYYCSPRSSPPDYQPTKLVTYYYTNPASVPEYWMTMSPGTALVFGKNQPGEIAVWYFPVTTAQEVLTGMGLPDPLVLDLLSVAWVSDSSTQDCTKWISGITPWYMPKW